MPSAFSMTFGVEPSITATQELVVPRSIPMTLPMVFPLFGGRPAGPVRHPEGRYLRGSQVPCPTPLINVKRRPLRRPGSYRRAPRGRKTCRHGFASESFKIARTVAVATGSALVAEDQ